MKETYSLEQVEKKFSGYNLLLPQSTDVQMSPFYSYHVEVVPCDTSENSGDIFKTGSINTGMKDQKGNFVWVETYALTKPMLNKLAMAAGIQFNPDQTFGTRVDQYTYRAKAQGAMRKSDGTARTETDQKEICLKDEEDKYRLEFMDKAAQGITDEKQAKEAAKLFKGTWVKLTNKWGKTVDGYLVDESDRQRYIDRSVMVNIALLRKTWAEKAMTGAKLRVIRALLGLKGTYTREELSRGFAIPTVVFSPDYNDPMVRQAMLTSGINGVTNMFGGGGQLSVKKIDFDQGEVIDMSDDDLENPAFASDRPDDDYAEDYMDPEPAEMMPDPEPAHYQMAQEEPRGYAQPPMQARQQSSYACTSCGAPISLKVFEFSTKKFGRGLCMNCQKGGRR